MRRIYIAAPFTDVPDKTKPIVLQTIARYGGHLMMKGIDSYSPLHDTAPAWNTLSPEDQAQIPISFFRSREPIFLGICTNLHILDWPGWTDSRGVKNELDIAIKKQMPVSLVHPITFELKGVNE